jgi:hypothetical protein
LNTGFVFMCREIDKCGAFQLLPNRAVHAVAATQ